MVHITLHVEFPGDNHDAARALRDLADALQNGDVLLDAEGRYVTPVDDTREALTLAQEGVYAAVKAYFARTGHAPSLRELCTECGYKSTNGMQEMLLRLDRKGYVRYTKGTARGLVVL